MTVGEGREGRETRGWRGRTVLDDAGLGRASVDSGLKDRAVPSVWRGGEEEEAVSRHWRRRGGNDVLKKSPWNPYPVASPIARTNG